MKLNPTSTCPSWPLRITFPSYKSFKYLKSLTFPLNSSSLAKITWIFFHIYEAVSSNSDHSFLYSELLPSGPNSSWILALKTDAVWRDCTSTANKANGFKLYVSRTILLFKHPSKIFAFSAKQHDTDSCSTCDPAHPQVLFLAANQLFLTLHFHSWQFLPKCSTPYLSLLNVMLFFRLFWTLIMSSNTQSLRI